MLRTEACPAANVHAPWAPLRGQPAPGGKPNRHLAVAVHAAERRDHGDDDEYGRIERDAALSRRFDLVRDLPRHLGPRLLALRDLLRIRGRRFWCGDDGRDLRFCAGCRESEYCGECRA